MPKIRKYRFCLLCGTPLHRCKIEGYARETCPSCGWIFYEQLKVGAGAIIEKGGRILLLRRTASPWQGDWNLPAGYVEADEDPMSAVERETLEETGLEVKARHLINAYYFDDDPRGNGIFLIYACDIVKGVIQNNFESSEFRFFNAIEIPKNLCGAGHARSIYAWQNKNIGLIDSIE